MFAAIVIGVAVVATLVVLVRELRRGDYGRPAVPSAGHVGAERTQQLRVLAKAGRVRPHRRVAKA